MLAWRGICRTKLLPVLQHQRLLRKIAQRNESSVMSRFATGKLLHGVQYLSCACVSTLQRAA